MYHQRRSIIYTVVKVWIEAANKVEPKELRQWRVAHEVSPGLLLLSKVIESSKKQLTG